MEKLQSSFLASLNACSGAGIPELIFVKSKFEFAHTYSCIFANIILGCHFRSVLVLYSFCVFFWSGGRSVSEYVKWLKIGWDSEQQGAHFTGQRAADSNCYCVMALMSYKMCSPLLEHVNPRFFNATSWGSDFALAIAATVACQITQRAGCEGDIAVIADNRAH